MPIISVSFSPDGNEILSASRGKLIVTDLNGLSILDKELDGLKYARFFPLKNRILTIWDDRSIKIYDTNLHIYCDFDQTPGLMGFNDIHSSLDGRFLLSSSQALLLLYTPDTIMEWLKRAPVYQLTKEDKKIFGIEMLNN